MWHFWKPLSPALSPPAGHTLPISWAGWLTELQEDRALSLFTSGHLTRDPAHEQVKQRGPSRRMQAFVAKRGFHGEGVKGCKVPNRVGL